MKNKIITIIGIFLVLALSLTFASALTIKSVSANPSQVEPGKQINLVLEIKNTLSDNIEDIEVSLDLTGLPLAPETSSVDYTENLDEDDTQNFEFDLIASADASAGVYKIPVKISYKIANQPEAYTKTFTTSVTINSKPELTLSIEGILIKNQKNQLQIKITNSGLNKAKLLEIELGNLGFYNLLSSNVVYIGDLDSDDFDTADFDIFLKESSNLNFPVTLRYRDAANKQITESKIVSAKVYSNEEAIQLGLIQKSNTKLYFYIAIAAIIIWFIWRKFKKRKRKKLEGGN